LMERGSTCPQLLRTATINMVWTLNTDETIQAPRTEQANRGEAKVHHLLYPYTQCKLIVQHFSYDHVKWNMAWAKKVFSHIVFSQLNR
jgi:hypothetical protein